MKKKNVPARNSPASRPGLPAATTARGIRRPCIASSTPATNSAMNTLRQNTISQALVIESWRTRMPPDDQQIAATIIIRIARRCARGSTGTDTAQALRSMSTCGMPSSR